MLIPIRRGPTFTVGPSSLTRLSQKELFLNIESHAINTFKASLIDDQNFDFVLAAAPCPQSVMGTYGLIIAVANQLKRQKGYRKWAAMAYKSTPEVSPLFTEGDR